MKGRLRLGCRAVILAGMALLATTPVSANAISITPLKSAARSLPRVRPVQVPLSTRVTLTPVGEVRYGLTDSAVIRQLDDARSEATTTLNSEASRVGTAAESSALEVAAKKCGQAGFKKVAADYYHAAQQGTAYPAFDNAFYYAVFGCLKGYFRAAPDDAVGTVATYLTGGVSRPAQDAVTTAPTAFANWLETTGNEVAVSSEEPLSATPAEPTQPPASDGDDGDGGGGSSLLWAFIAAGVLLAAYGLYRARKS